ncbi:MAG: PfkB family carbohydrate kinase, partial [Cypionkella sp.]
APLRQAVSHPIPGLFVLRMDGEEAESIAGHTLETRVQSADFASDLVKRGVAKRVIVARGADGSVMAETGRRVFAKAAKVQVVSTVGAGDSFVAGFVLSLARGVDSALALAYGSASASAAVTTDATQLCRLQDVERLLPDCEISAV